MQRVDLVIAGLAVVAVVGSVVGMSLYDDAPAQAEWNVTFPVQEARPGNEVAGMSISEADDSATDSWTLSQTNLTAASFSVQITGGDATRAEDLVVGFQIVSPNGTTETGTLTLPAASQQNAAGTTVAFELDQVPATRTIAAETEAEALADLPIGMNGTGEWEITAAITSGARPVLPEMVTVTVEVNAYEYWSAQATRAGLPDLSPAA